MAGTCLVEYTAIVHLRSPNLSTESTESLLPTCKASRQKPKVKHPMFKHGVAVNNTSLLARKSPTALASSSTPDHR
jgi:hypothetical protein